VDTEAADIAHAGTSSPPLDPAKFVQAKRRLAAMKGFYIHLIVFLLVVAGLLVVNVAAGGEWWVQWVLLGWGVGVIAHAAAVFGHIPRMIADWERRKIKQLMQGP
jgi:hypothetical protein